MLVDGADIATRVAEATGNAQILLGLESIGGEATLSVTGSVAPGGSVVIYSAASGQSPVANYIDIIFRNVSVHGFWIDSPAVRNSPKAQEALTTGARLIAEGKLHSPVAAVYPLTAAKEAFTHAQNGGKVLFKIS